MKVRAYAAQEPGGTFQPFEYELAAIGPEEVDIDVRYCGICHSDLSMLNNEWQMTSYPVVPGHEVVGTVSAVGGAVKNLSVGQTVGVGWFSRSCMTCEQCMAGDHNLCGSSEGILVGRHGGFAETVRVHAGWAVPLPEGVRPETAGPLFCGGVTVFNPIVQCGVRPTDRVGVIGIGGLGHMALRFLNAWGCEVTAFSSNESKETEARELGAHHFVNSRDGESLAQQAGTLDFIISTVNVSLNWEAYLGVLRPRGRLHLVGAVLEPVAVPVFPLLTGQKAVSASPLGSPATTARMLEFCARHQIEPITQGFALSEVNEAMEVLKSGKARYRVVLENDLRG